MSRSLPEALERLQRTAGPGETDIRVLHEAFGRYRDAVHASALKLTGDPQLAEDLTQQVLLVAWESLPRYRGESAFSTWLYGICLNTWRNQQRKRAELLTEDGVFDQRDEAVGVIASLGRHEREAVFRDVCAQALDPVEQQVVHLRYVRELPRAEVEEVLGLQPGAVRGIVQRCQRKLERALRRRLAQLGHGTSFLRSGTE